MGDIIPLNENNFNNDLVNKSMPIISSFMELLFGRFSKTSIVTESVDIVLIRHRNSHIPYTESETVDDDLGSWENLVATTLSLLMLLLYFTLFEYLGSCRGDSCLVHSAKFIKLNCLVLYSYKFFLFYLIFNI